MVPGSIQVAADARHKVGFNIALSSADTLISPMYHSFRLSEIGQKYAPQIRLVQKSIPMLPSPIRRATEIAKAIDTQRADLAGARERYQYCTDHHNLVVSLPKGARDRMIAMADCDDSAKSKKTGQMSRGLKYCPSASGWYTAFLSCVS